MIQPHSMTVQGKVAEFRDMEFEAVYIRRRISFQSKDPLTLSSFGSFVVELFVTIGDCGGAQAKP